MIEALPYFPSLKSRSVRFASRALFQCNRNRVEVIKITSNCFMAEGSISENEIQMPIRYNLQKLLDENHHLLMQLTDLQNKGRISECQIIQNHLFKNLLYLTTVANNQFKKEQNQPSLTNEGSGTNEPAAGFSSFKSSQIATVTDVQEPSICMVTPPTAGMEQLSSILVPQTHIRVPVVNMPSLPYCLTQPQLQAILPHNSVTIPQENAASYYQIPVTAASSQPIVSVSSSQAACVSSSPAMHSGTAGQQHVGELAPVFPTARITTQETTSLS